MSSHKDTSKLIDGLLKVALLGGVVSVGLTAPNAIKSLDKPIFKALDALDERSRKRKLKATLRYMKAKGLVTGSYDHGIEITKVGKKRLEDVTIRELAIEKQDEWDGRWRIVFFDIPETKRDARVALARMLKTLGYQLLQRSIWIHPYPSKEEIAKVCEYHGVSKWLTYIETSHIDNEKELKSRFKKIL